jgi:hypothetical protein
MSASGSSARSSLFIQLSPTRSTKLSFTVQMALALFGLIWAVMLLISDSKTEEVNYFYYVFCLLAVAYMGYVILQNTSVFGIQSYIEVTPEYIVRKHGVFRPKLITALPDIVSVHISPLAIRITQKDGEVVYHDLKQVRKKKDLAKIKRKIKDLSEVHQFEVTETTVNR